MSAPATAVTDEASMIKEAADRIAGAGESPSRPGRDPVNLPMINNWLEAIGDTNPVYARAGLAPPAMVQVWTMRGLHPVPDAGDPLQAMATVLDEAGYTSIVATNCEQVYHRYLRVGEQVEVRSRLTGVSGPKRTALGEGWFVTTQSSWYVGADLVATMLFRVLKYRPATQPPAAPAGPAPVAGAIRPVISRDTEFFWAGTGAGELRIQRCEACGALRHPPGPACPDCGALRPGRMDGVADERGSTRGWMDGVADERGSTRGYVVAAGTGSVYSFVVHHHPPLPGRTVPVVIALVQLAEGVRMVGELLDADPADVHIGAEVEIAFVRVDDELTLPAWRLAGSTPPPDPAPSPPAAPAESTVQDEGGLPELRVEATPTFVIASALATRDFQDVHHDRDRAVARGSKDIFLNILTSTGLVQRYVTDWAGSRAVVRSIAIRLGVPCYAYDTLSMTGRVASQAGDEYTVEVVGRDSLGDHVTGTVVVHLPGGLS